MNNRIYISGAITNNPNHESDFLDAQIKLLERGYQVINPVIVGKQLPKDLSYKEYMQIDLKLLDLCDSIYMLEGWENSIGACCEYSYARTMGKNILFQTKNKNTTLTESKSVLS